MERSRAAKSEIRLSRSKCSGGHGSRVARKKGTFSGAPGPRGAGPAAVSPCRAPRTGPGLPRAHPGPPGVVTPWPYPHHDGSAGRKGGGITSLLLVKDIYVDVVSSGVGTTATVSSKGQITLPKAFRERHNLREGETVLVLETRDGVLIRHGRKSLRGILRGQVDAELLEKSVRALRSEWRL